MEDCCHVPATQDERFSCPGCGQQGKSVPILTLKALLRPSALEILDPQLPYAFCSNPTCEVVYFSGTQAFQPGALKVPVFQKDPSPDVSVCYCFGWTRERLIRADFEDQHPAEQIREHVQANRCGCEVNNPQGVCCLGNITTFLRTLTRLKGSAHDFMA